MMESVVRTERTFKSRTTVTSGHSQHREQRVELRTEKEEEITTSLGKTREMMEEDMGTLLRTPEQKIRDLDWR